VFFFVSSSSSSSKLAIHDLSPPPSSPALYKSSGYRLQVYTVQRKSDDAGMLTVAALELTSAVALNKKAVEGACARSGRKSDDAGVAAWFLLFSSARVT